MPDSPLADVADAVARLPREIVEAAAERFEELADESAARAVGHGGVMMLKRARGGTRPAKLRTRAIISRRNVATTALILGRPAGLWVWIDSGTAAHTIVPRKRRGGRGGRPPVMASPEGTPGGLDHPFSGIADHPGTTGDQAWSRAVADMDFEIDGLAEAELKELIRRG